MKKILIELDSGLARELSIQAAKSQISRKRLISIVLDEYIDKVNKKEQQEVMKKLQDGQKKV